MVNAYENGDKGIGDQQHLQQQRHEETQATVHLNTDVEAEQDVPLAGCSSELVAVQNRVLELEQKLLEQQASSTSTCLSSTADHLDDASVLELFVMTAKEKLLQSVPPTDAECGFDLITGKCTPICHCEFRPQWGDYSPARACRLMTPPVEGEQGVQCDPNKVEAPWAAKLLHALGRYARRATEQAKAKLVEMAPPTHEECRFSFKSVKCEPSDLCIWDFHPGDFTLDRACRYRVDRLD